MAKASTGRAAPAKVKAPPPAASARKAKAVAAAPKKKAAGKKDAVKAAAPKMAPPPKKGAAPQMAPAPKKGAAKAAPPKKAAAKGKAPPPKQVAAPKKGAPAKKAAPVKAASPKKAAPVKAAAAKSAAKTVAVKKAAPRRRATRTAVPTPASRRVRPPVTARKPVAATSALAGVGPQIFTVSHLDEADFKTDGLRTYAQYRDLGIAAATGGLCQAHVIRFTPPCTDEVRKRHQHEADLQLVYVLQGWMKNEFEGHGEQMMSAGSCWLQPSGIKHTVLDYSPDCEVLEIIVPADFKTEETL